MAEERLVRAIEALLEPYVRGAAARRARRRPVLGSVSIGRGEARVAGPGPVWPGILTGPGMRIEPGALAFGADPQPPLTIWTTTALRDWLSGDGIVVPGSDPEVYTHLVGRVTWDSTAGLVWPDDPALAAMVDGGYPSGGYASAGAVAAVLRASPPPWTLRTPAGPYTGGARLLAEACLSSGRGLASRLPAGWTTAPGRMGLLWSPDLEPWAVMIGSDGALAARLGIGTVGAAMRSWIRDETLSGIGLHLAWLHVCADLEPLESPGESDIVWLVEESEMVDAYDEGGYLAMAGWVWESGPVASHGAVVVNRDAVAAGYPCWESRLLEISVAWTDGQPSGLLSVGDWSTWRVRHAYHHLWAGAGGVVSQLRHTGAYPDAITDALSESAPVVCRYILDSGLEVERYYRSDSVSIGGTSDYPGYESANAALNNCEGGGSVTDWSGALYRIDGGIGTSAPAPIVVGGGSWQVRSWSIQAGEWDEPGSHPASWASVTAWWQMVACSGDSPDDSWSSGGGKWTLPSGWPSAGWGLVGRNATGTAHRYDWSVTSGGGGQAWIYLSDCPDMAARVDWTSAEASHMEHRTWEREVSHMRRVDAWGLNPSPPPYGTWTRLYQGLGTGYVSKGWGGSVSCTGQYVVCGGEAPAAYEEADLGAHQTGTWSVRVGGGVVASGGELDAWTDLTAPTADPVSCGLSAWMSALGSIVWVPAPGSSPESECGLPFAATSAMQSWCGS